MVLRAILMPREDPDLTKAALRLLRDAAPHALAVGHVVIGEAFGGIHRDLPLVCEPHDCASIEFSRLLQDEKVTVRTIDDPNSYHRFALDLHRLDKRLGANDCLILSLALLDPGYDMLVTNDYTMAKSRDLTRLAQELGKEIRPLHLEDTQRRRRRSYGGNRG